MDNQISNAATRTGDQGIANTQAQVGEVVNIMRQNVEKILERDQKLSELDSRADALEAGAMGFTTTAGRLQRKHFWENMKMMIIIGAIGGVLLIIIIVWATR